MHFGFFLKNTYTRTYISHFLLLDFHCEAFAQQNYDKWQKFLQAGQAVQPVPKAATSFLL